VRWPWPVALVGSVATAAMVVGGLVFAALEPSASTIGWAVVGGAAALLCAGLGTLVARRVRDNPVGPLLVAVGACVAFSCTRQAGFEVLAHHDDTAERLNWLVALTTEASSWLFAAIGLLLVYFPDGRVPGRRWRLVPMGLVVGAASHHLYGVVSPDPYLAPLQDLPHAFGPPPLAVEALSIAGDLILLVSVLASAAALLVKYRQADAPGKQQLKWLALAGVGVPGFIVVCLSEVLLTGEGQWPSLVIGIAAIFGIPVAIAIAMLRADLYDVDRALATTVAWGLATAVLVVIFVAASLAAGVLLGRDSTVAAAAATAICAVALAPLRRRLQQRVDARVYPLRQAALAAIDELQREVNVGAARPEQLADRLRAALRDPELRVGYLRPGGNQLVEELGSPMDAAGSVPIVSGETTIGALAATSPLLSNELLRQVAAASVTLVELVRLRLEVTAALREVEASRARLVQVGDRERRRLERDLHDGAQQRLVALGMALRLAQRRRKGTDPELDGLLDQTVAEIGTAVSELRQIAHGLRPSSLDDGLQAALVALTQHVPIPVELHVHSAPLPDEVTITVYYVASEAIANAVKHADATRIDVRITRHNGHVEVRVADDGRGGARVSTGSGLAGLNDRVTAVGGRLALASEERCGTVVEAVVPCAS
jgi:signal transduction histidine kinase